MSETHTDAQTDEVLAVPVAELRPALEAVLMVADQPLDQVTLATAVGYPVTEVSQELTALAGEYDEQGRGFELRNVAGGWRFYTRDAYASVVEKFVLDGQQARLTQAALETLAVVAYKQPVSRARVSAIRGVNVDGVMRTLLARGLVEEAGQDHETGANLYKTTNYWAPEHERTLVWNDASLRIEWPIHSEPTLSTKDRNGTTLQIAELFT